MRRIQSVLFALLLLLGAVAARSADPTLLRRDEPREDVSTLKHWDESASLAENRVVSTGRSLLGALICDDGTDDDDDVVCCPSGCSGNGRCVADFGCDCVYNWGGNGPFGWPDCHMNHREEWLRDSPNGRERAWHFFVAWCAILWTIFCVWSIVAFVLWLMSGGMRVALITHASLIAFTLLRVLWIFIDPFETKGIFPRFWEQFFHHLAYPMCVLSCALYVAFWAHLNTQLQIGGGVVEKLESYATPVGGALAGCLFIIQLACDVVTAKRNHPSLVWHPLSIIYAIFLIGGGLAFLIYGLKLYMASREDDKEGRIGEATIVGAINSVLLICLSCMLLAGVWTGPRGAYFNPWSFYGLKFIAECCFLFITGSMLFVMRPPKVDTMLGREPEVVDPGAKFGADTTGAHHDDDDVGGPQWRADFG